MAKISCGQAALWLTFVYFATQTDAMAQLAQDCGSIKNAYGPFDYTNPDHFANKLPIVESGHFDAGVEQLTGHLGKSSEGTMLAGDLDYTLRAFPNHHRALYATVRYDVEKIRRGAAPMRFSTECYFKRAILLAPSDATVRLLQGIYFMKVSRPEEARVSLGVALDMAPNSAEINYNAGLVYTDLKEYELALQHALRAYELGYPLMGLKNKLKRLGVWKDNQVAVEEAAQLSATEKPNDN